MVKRLNPGRNIDTLKREWDEFFSLPFPKEPKEDYLADLFAELVLFDGHVAGIVTSFLKGKKVDKKLIFVKETLNINLQSYKPLDSESKFSQEKIIERKNRLDRLVKLVLELYDKY
jgi:hypothetical protein